MHTENVECADKAKHRKTEQKNGNDANADFKPLLCVEFFEYIVLYITNKATVEAIFVCSCSALDIFSAQINIYSGFFFLAYQDIKVFRYSPELLQHERE